MSQLNQDETAFRPYNLSEEAFDLLEDVQAALNLFGMMAVEQNRGVGGIPSEEVGRTVLLLGKQLNQVIADCQSSTKPNLRAVKSGGTV